MFDDDVKIWGITDAAGFWQPDRGHLYFSFDLDDLEDFGEAGYLICEIPDEVVALSPKAAAALAAMYQIRAARLEYQNAQQAQRPTKPK